MGADKLAGGLVGADFSRRWCSTHSGGMWSLVTVNLMSD